MVIKDNVKVGSITCNVSKKEGKPIVYVSEMKKKTKLSYFLPICHFVYF